MKNRSLLMLTLICLFLLNATTFAQDVFTLQRDDTKDTLAGYTLTDARGNGPWGFVDDPKIYGLNLYAISEVFNPVTGGWIAFAEGYSSASASAKNQSSLTVAQSNYVMGGACGLDNSEAEAITGASAFVESTVQSSDVEQQHALLKVTFDLGVTNTLMWDANAIVRVNGGEVFKAEGSNGFVMMTTPYGPPTPKSFTDGEPGTATYTVGNIPVKVGDKITIWTSSSIGSDIFANGNFLDLLVESVKISLVPNPNPPLPPNNGGSGDGDDSDDDSILGGGF